MDGWMNGQVDNSHAVISNSWLMELKSEMTKKIAYITDTQTQEQYDYEV